jgi:colanic acid/amylovoran biosynthesis glycosyltransferase
MPLKSKILVIVTVFPSVTETFILNQITDLIDRGFEVTIFSYVEPKNKVVHQLYIDYQLDKQTVTHFKNHSSKLKVFLKAFNFFRKHLKRIDFSKLILLLNPLKIKTSISILKKYYDLPILLFKDNFDVVHCHFGFNGKKVADVYELGICVYPKAILSFHGSDLTPSKLEMYKKLYQGVFKYFQGFTVNSIYLKDILTQINQSVQNVHLIPEGFKKAYLEQFAKVQKDNSAFQIVFCGRLINWKGPDRALRILKKMIDSGRENCILHLIGDGEMKEELLALSKSLQIEKQVVFYGAIPQEKVFQTMAKSTVFLLPGISELNTERSEAQGLVLQEAQFFKLPVITSDVGGIKYGIIPNETGFLMEENTENEFVEKLNMLYDKPELIKSMGEKGHEFVMMNFESSIIGKKLESLYLI